MDMKCEGCVNAVKNKLETINGRSFSYLLRLNTLMLFSFVVVAIHFCLQRDWIH